MKLGSDMDLSIPMMDTRSRERRPGYADYEARTSSLILWPPKGS